MASSIQKIHDPSIASSPGLALALCPDCRSVLTTGLDFHLRRWDLEKGICTHAWDAHGPLYAIKIVESEGSALLAAVQGIVRWDLQEWELHAANTVWSYASIQAIGHAVATDEVLGASEDSTIHRWILESGEKLDSLPGHHTSVSALDVNPPGSLALSGDLYGGLRL